jgi:hypothetical protein
VVCVLTPIFNVLTSEASVRSAIQGLVDAVLITGLVGGYLIFLATAVSGRGSGASRSGRTWR